MEEALEMEQTHLAKTSLRLLHLAGVGGRVSGSGDVEFRFVLPEDMSVGSYSFGGPETGTSSWPCLLIAVAARPEFSLGSVGDSFPSAVLGPAEDPLGFVTLGELG